VNILVKYFKTAVFVFAVPAFMAFFYGGAAAVNEGFNPRLMHEANKMISSYEAEILKNGPSVEFYEWIIKGLKIRKNAYFDYEAGAEIEAKISEKYKKILEIDPVHYEALCEIAGAEINAGLIGGQLGKLDGMVKNNPARYEARLLKGRVLFYSADFDGAIVEITRAVSMIPGQKKDETSYYKKMLEAANKFSMVMKKNAADGEKDIMAKDSAAHKYYSLALVFLDEEMVKYPANINRGIELLKKATEKDPGHCEAFIKLGETLGALRGDYKEAMKALSKVDSLTKEKSVLKRARLLRQRYYQLDMTKGKTKKK
jgi:tetratricopeptide (TPR) repeat protein